MRYRMRYDVGPLYARRPTLGTGLLATVLGALWLVVMFVAQLVVWAVLLAVGLVYTIVWLVTWPIARLI